MGNTISSSIVNCPGMRIPHAVLAIPSLASALLALMVLAATSLAWAGEISIAVIYPNIGEPYREIFEKIIEGVESKAGSPVAKHALRSDTDIDALKSALRQQNVKVAIGLGRQGMQAAMSLNNNIGVVVGGVLTMPESEVSKQPVLSLAPDPALLFARLKEIMPEARRVFVVYDPNINGWLIKLASEAAHNQGLELVTYEAQNLRSAVRLYQNIFSAANSRRDALWLPQDSSTVEESSVLPLILQESWNQSIAVFSSNFSHVRRGALFSLYPDNVALGKTLAGLAQDFLISGGYGKRGLLPLRDVQTAVNLRTAKHLGLNTSRQQNYAMTFPEQ